MPFMSLHGAEFGYDRQSGQIRFKGRPIDMGGAFRGDGRIFFVNSAGNGGANSSGLNPSEANATIPQAFDKCAADRGDVILLMPGHNETITTTPMDFDVAGVTVIGLGRGDQMARIHFNHANATIDVAEDNIGLDNVRLSADITSVAIGIDVEAGSTDFSLTNCLFDTVTGGTDEFTLGVDLKAGADRAVIENNVFDMGIAATVASVMLTGASDRVTVRGNEFHGDASTAHINGITTLSTRVLIEDNLIVNGVGGNINSEPGIELLTATTGIIRRNDIVCNLGTKAASIVADTCLYFENYYNEDIAGTGGLIGTASADD